MSGRDINNIIEIMIKDFKGAFSHPLVTIVLIAVIILPSLYALLNIQACWDPYGNTGDVEFAIANLDNGTSFNGNLINVGDELVKTLKDNDKFKWTFVTEDDLRTGVYNGTYYAGIVIPKNLSENVVSIAGDDPKQAELEYVVNMKTNPVASKLTDSGANAVYQSLNAKIVEIIDLAAYGKLGELQSGLASGAQQLASGGSQLSAGASKVSSGAGQVSSGASQVSSGASQVQDGANQVKTGASSVSDAAGQVQKGSTDLQKGAAEVSKGSEELQAAVDPSLMPDGPVKEYTESNVKLANGTDAVASGASKLADGSVKLANGSVKLANGSAKVADGSSKLADGSVQLAEGSLSLAAGAEMLSNAAAKALFTAAASLGSSAQELAAVTGINESMLGDYIYSPVKLNRHEIFPVSDYGSDVAPFYLVLSMWVGGIITCVMLKPGTSAGTKYSPFEMYFGKLLIFIIMSILQACVTIIGCYILGVSIANPLLFIPSAILVSVTFMILIYSIISSLGTVGKGIAVILLVFQISATGGIYPIEIMHPFFQTLYPYMPMTYGITLIREAQLGLVWSNYLLALGILIAIAILTVIVALIIKEKADKPAHYLEERLEGSGLL